MAIKASEIGAILKKTLRVRLAFAARLGKRGLMSISRLASETP
ncbi:hypothetical protein P7F60_04865 [Rhizobium sp. YJ-22]|nr:hypothetical protein [Rhizobium sp. YJ-22]MDG3575706.1 hypothetical protein [Rhizobium sp. YJ-22]